VTYFWAILEGDNILLYLDPQRLKTNALPTMKSTTIATALFASSLLLATHAQLIPFLTKGEPNARVWKAWDEEQPKPKHQHPMDPSGPGIQLPPSNNDGDKPSNGRPTGDVILSDVISTQRNINIFAGFTRDVLSVSSRLDSTGQNTTVLAPLNSAITSLPRKPWEDPREYAALGADAYAGKDGEDRASRNMRRFTEAHIVPVSPWKEGEKMQSMGGGTLWWEKRDGRAVVMPGEVEVEKVASQVANGEVWVLKGVVNYAS
jgi:hypothetical protein